MPYVALVRAAIKSEKLYLAISISELNVNLKNIQSTWIYNVYECTWLCTDVPRDISIFR